MPSEIPYSAGVQAIVLVWKVASEKKEPQFIRQHHKTPFDHKKMT